MSPLTVLALSVGLAMDATAVAATRGLAARSLRARDVLLMALLFGAFQGLMPLLGWFLGEALGSLVTTWDHWIACGLLSAIGGKMLWSPSGLREESRPEADAGVAPTSAQPLDDRERFGIRVLVLLAIATSIDALAVGVTLPMLGAPMAYSLVSIGLVTAVLSALGAIAGRVFGSALGRRLDAFGGVVLIGIGVQILVEHLRTH